MHIFFSGIGGTGIGPLALIAKQSGHQISGSDKQNSQYIEYLKKNGIPDIHIGQEFKSIEEIHRKSPIEWYVYSSAVEKENVDHPEIKFINNHSIKITKRDELLNYIIQQNKLRLLAVAGTHGKTTTTAMLIYLLKSISLPLSYSVGAKIGFGDMGHYEADSKYFALEADEFDRNFLSFSPYISIISGISYDHHEIYPTQESYNEAFVQFLGQSQYKIIWKSDFDKLKILPDDSFTILDDSNSQIQTINLPGLVNKKDAWLVLNAVSKITKKSISEMVSTINSFPGVSRRMEKIKDNIYSDYAHTTDKIIGAIDIAKEMAKKNNQKLIIIYEPLTNRRMHHTIRDHYDIFSHVDRLYWVPSYLAREDPSQHILTPVELISNLSDVTKAIAEPAKFDESLKANIENHVSNGDLVIALSGGGGGSLDEWLREKFAE